MHAISFSKTMTSCVTTRLTLSQLYVVATDVVHLMILWVIALFCTILLLHIRCLGIGNSLAGITPAFFIDQFVIVSKLTIFFYVFFPQLEVMCLMLFW